jgi:tRNA A37 threonylcarbamoyladenosine synthetase subunit TsaC/SUA5/YrdC
MTDASSRQLAANLIKEGYPVGFFVRAVCGIWVDGENADAIEAIYRIKGERRVGRPMSTVLSTLDFVQLIDPDEVPSGLRGVVLDAGGLEARFGSLGFIRAPIRHDAVEALPPSTVSQTPDGKYWLQNYIPGALDVVTLFVNDMLEQGVGVPAATSMNISGQPEIVEQEEGIAFCNSQGIPLFLADPSDKGRVRGSFPIISIERAGIKLLREGQFPGYLVQCLFGCGVDMSDATRPKYPVVRTHSERSASTIPPHQLHDEIVACLDSGDGEAALGPASPVEISFPGR